MRAETPIDLAFLDDAVFEEGVPANFKGAIPTCQVSPLIKYVEQTGARKHFRHRRISDIGSGPGYLTVGMFGSPYNWVARPGQSHSFADKATNLRSLLEQYPRLKLLIDYSWEGGLDKGFLQEFDRFVGDTHVDPRRIVLLVSNRGLEARYKAHLATKNLSLTNSWQMIGADLFLLYSGVEFRQRRWFGRPDSVISTAEVEHNKRNLRSHKFVSLNRRPRWHRFMLAMTLTRLDMQRQGLSSMPSPAYEGDWRSEHDTLEMFGRLMDPAVWQKLKEVEEPTMAALPWTIDVNIDMSGHTSGYAFQNLNRDVFLRSYVQIVTESYMEGLPGELFLTEKICKALANLQPFICFGMARSNARLVELGFEPVNIVYGAYDDELDLGRRLTRLYHALEQLAGMSLEAVHEAYHAALPRASHNQQRLFEMPEVLGEEIASRLRAMLPG
jgi:hypothetical protein